MSRMWKILEDSHPYESFRYGARKSMKSKEDEAYCEGYEDGFAEAMESVSEKYGHLGFRGESTHTSGGSMPNYRMGYRDDEDDMMGERRRRRANGRYY